MRIFINAFILLLPVTVNAHNTLFSHGLHSNFIFTLGVAYADFFQPELAQQPVARVYEVSAEFFETPTPYLQGGLHVGRFQLEGVNQPPLENMDMGGSFGGMRLQTMLWNGTHVKWGLDSLYRYYISDNKTTPDSSWHSIRAASATSLTVWERTGVYGVIGAIGGTGKIHTSEVQAFTWTTRPRMLGIIGFDAEVDPGGHIGIESQLTDSNNISIYFQRRY